MHWLCRQAKQRSITAPSTVWKPLLFFVLGKVLLWYNQPTCRVGFELHWTPFSSFLSKCCTARDWFCLRFYSGLFEHEKQIFVLIYLVNVLLTASFSLICFASAVTFSTVMALWLQQYIYSLNESGSTATVACSQTVLYLINTWATAEFQSNLV